MDNILACYKDGTNGTRNCRYFGVVYHLAFIVIMSGFLTESILLLGVNAFMCVMIGLSVAVIQPYKAKVYNIVDTVLILSVGMGFAACICMWIAHIADPQDKVLTEMIAIIPLFTPVLYISGYVALKLGRKLYPLCCIFSKLKAILTLANRERLNNMYSISENTASLQ